MRLSVYMPGFVCLFVFYYKNCRFKLHILLQTKSRRKMQPGSGLLGTDYSLAVFVQTVQVFRAFIKRKEHSKMEAEKEERKRGERRTKTRKKKAQKWKAKKRISKKKGRGKQNMERKKTERKKTESDAENIAKREKSERDDSNHQK